MKVESIELVITKTKAGYSIINDTYGSVDYFEDDDEGRQAFVKYIAEVMNTEVENGRKYF